MSQNECLDLELDPITEPLLTNTNYGADIKEKFQNINDNFTKLSNIDLYKGEDGNSLIIEEVSLSKDEEKSDEVSYKLYAALADTFTNKFSGSINSSPNGKKWDEYIETYKIPLVKRTNEMDENDDVYLGSIMPILFFDGRFSSESIVENNSDFSVYNGIDDCTCIVQFAYENGSWKCIINESFPKLSYRNGNFYWVIGGVESTAIRATGVKGERGAGAHIWMCNGVSGNEGEIMVDKYITSEGGSITEKQFETGKIIEGSDTTYYGVEGDPVFVFDYDQRVSDDESGETYYKDYKGIVIAHLQKYNAEKQQWIARVDGDIKHVNFVKNTVEFFKTLGENNGEGVEPARGLFLTTGTQNQCHSIFNKDNNLIIAPQRDYSTGWGDDGNVDFNPLLHVVYNTEFLNKATFNTQTNFSGETNFTKDGIINVACELHINDSGFINSVGNINSHGEFNSYGAFNVDTQKNISLKHNHGMRDKKYEKFGIDGDSHRVYLQTGKIDENTKKDIRDSEIVLDDGYITIGVNVDGVDYTNSRGIVIKTTNNDTSVNSEFFLSKEGVNLKSNNIYSTGNYSHTGPLIVAGNVNVTGELHAQSIDTDARASIRSTCTISDGLTVESGGVTINGSSTINGKILTVKSEDDYRINVTDLTVKPNSIILECSEDQSGWDSSLITNSDRVEIRNGNGDDIESKIELANGTINIECCGGDGINITSPESIFITGYTQFNGNIQCDGINAGQSTIICGSISPERITNVTIGGGSSSETSSVTSNVVTYSINSNLYNYGVKISRNSTIQLQINKNIPFCIVRLVLKTDSDTQKTVSVKAKFDNTDYVDAWFTKADGTYSTTINVDNSTTGGKSKFAIIDMIISKWEDDYPIISGTWLDKTSAGIICS